MSDWNQDFQGKGLDQEAYDAILCNRWPSKERAAEAVLFDRKHFDYRHMHPVEATYLFGHIFVTEVRKFIRAYIDNTPPSITPSGKVRDWMPLKGGDIFESPSDDKRVKGWIRKTNALIRARQFVDNYGISYSFAIKEALRHWYFGRDYIFEYREMPGPDMITNDDCVQVIAEKWMQEIESRIIYSDHPRYQIIGETHPDLDKHQDFILAQILRKTDPVPALRKFIGLGVLSEERARMIFQHEHVDRALVVK